MPTARKTEELQQALRVICKVIGQIPYFHVHEDYIAPRYPTGPTTQWLAAMAYNAAIDSSLIHLRCFNEFFRSGGRPDDIRAYHFPCPSMQEFLSASEVAEIDKHLAHLTFGRAEIERKPWDLDGFVVAGLRRGVEFLTCIDASFPILSEEGRAEVRGVRDSAEIMIRKIIKQHGAPPPQETQ